MNPSEQAWVWDELFAANIPESWTKREVDGRIEIVPPEPVGAVHLKVLRRKRGPAIRPGEASLLLADFAKKQGVTSLGASHQVEDSGYQRAGGSFRTYSSPGVKCWDVVVHVWPERALVGSYVHDCEHRERRREALNILNSVRRPNDAQPDPY